MTVGKLQRVQNLVAAAMGLTVYMVTHDLDSLFSVCDRIAVLGADARGGTMVDYRPGIRLTEALVRLLEERPAVRPVAQPQADTA